jgi:hypothetical protein
MKVVGDIRVEMPAMRDENPKRAIVRAGADGMLAIDSDPWEKNAGGLYVRVCGVEA